MKCPRSEETMGKEAELSCRTGRMRLLSVVALFVLVGFAGPQQGPVRAENLVNGTSLRKFVDELPIMPIVRAYQVDEQGTVRPVANLTIGMFQTRWKFHKDLPSSKVFAYGTSESSASVPGPTIVARIGLGVDILWENHLPMRHILPLDTTISTAIPPHGGIPTVVHLHGGMNQPDSDGHSMAWFTAGFRDLGPEWSSRRFHYNNLQGANLWYHDHAMGLTRANILAGLAGAYLIRDPELESRLNLPLGDEFDRVLMLSDRDFNKDGSIFMNPKGNNPEIHPQWQPEYFGSVILVNGKAWPFLRVQRRQYRFRIINSSNARFYQLWLSTDSSKSALKFTQIGSDAFFLPHSVHTRSITIAPSEIFDVVVDFSVATEDIILKNTAAFPFPGGDPVDSNSGTVMKFVLQGRSSKHRAQEASRKRIPSSLVPIQKLKLASSMTTRTINLYEFVSARDEPTHLFINALPFEAPATETPKSGTTEMWNVINLTEDNHPLHVHLAGFQVLKETRLKHTEDLRDCLLQNQNQFTGDSCSLDRFIDPRRGSIRRPTRGEAGWKNVYKMKPSTMTSLLVRFATIDGRPYPFDASAEPGYVYHCHILDHEDNEMMRPLKLRK